MPVWKYRSIEETPEAWTMRQHIPLGRRMRAIFNLGFHAEPLNMPRGVHKFRSIEEANAFREFYERQRIARIRARNERNSSKQ